MINIKPDSNLVFSRCKFLKLPYTFRNELMYFNLSLLVSKKVAVNTFFKNPVTYITHFGEFLASLFPYIKSKYRLTRSYPRECIPPNNF